MYAVSVADGRHRELDLRMAATMELPEGVVGQFDVGLDLTRRDELELIGTDGRITVPDPWLCRTGTVELTRDGRTERLDVDPDRAWELARDDLDAYRIEFDVVSAAIGAGTPQPWDRSDAVAQAAVIEALRRSGRERMPVSCDTAAART